ncbi:Cerato-platanin-domain-containing protein [Suillus subalutaceus]|uniref:Cerato-platanin-domain-containing protein n=1 Tax=Suillus subalutaceus TaxID=48586 RepID=UPI001B87A335|nr:Cerato-platanin-domain-containing protein [Suillus subalutaceus]KAG1872437.1 Cerato-platanin-domain-containing protein [Suillus subalutaceus]
MLRAYSGTGGSGNLAQLGVSFTRCQLRELRRRIVTAWILGLLSLEIISTLKFAVELSLGLILKVDSVALVSALLALHLSGEYDYYVLNVSKLTLVVALLSVFALPAFGIPGYVTWDATYSNPDASLNTVSCSNGKNCLLTKGYTTFASLPSFPNIGGVPGNSWNSTLCGSCWSLKYATPSGHQTTVYVTAIDNSYTYNISPQAFDRLTDGTGFETGKIKVRANRVPTSKCGL